MLERVKRVNMYAKFFKRFLDFILSLCAVIALSPVLLILIVLGTIFMRGNPFFFQERPVRMKRYSSSLNSVLWIIEEMQKVISSRIA